MPIDIDLKNAYSTLYDKKDPSKALSQYEAILKQSPESISALVYKAACLEKLYFGESSWHNENTLENAEDLLQRALQISEKRGDRSKIGFVQFRLFIHYFNNHQSLESLNAFNSSRKYGYDDPTIGIWESKLKSKLTKWRKKGLVPENIEIFTTNEEIAPPVTTTIPVAPTTIKEETKPEPVHVVVPPRESKPVDAPVVPQLSPIREKIRTDWYQTPNTIVVSLFTTRVPANDSDIQTVIGKNNSSLSINWSLPNESSEFQYDINLFDAIEESSIRFKVFSKKVEITMDKSNKRKTWKMLESSNQSNTDSGDKKKTKDWSKIKFNDDDDDGDELIEDNDGSADAFFQKIYANADPDTQKAMMKSFIESNGTTLNTNWDDVKTGEVKPSPPEGMELKHW